MAPVKPVRSLYDSCLDEVLNVVHLLISKDRKFKLFKAFLISNLHGGIREHLIERSISRYSKNIFDMLVILELLGDPTTKKLNFKQSKIETLTGLQSRHLYSSLDSGNIVGLHELIVKVKMEHTKTIELQLLSSNLLHNALKKGLANSLRVLTLHNSADNQALKIIGQHAQHLTHLDITSSWVVDDIGIGDLLLKNASQLLKGHSGELEICEPLNKALDNLPKSQLNQTCETLQEVRIQHTNTSSLSVLLLLMFCRNLRSLGGFLYYRNIGDAVLSLLGREGAPSTLALTKLWDTQLPHEKLIKISKYLPNLNTLYTRAPWLPVTPGILPPLTHLTADFDFAHYGPILFGYLSHSGVYLRRLILIDQSYSLDISDISKLCPNLEELTAKVMIQDYSSKEILNNLQQAKVRISCSSTFTWIMKHCPKLERFEILLEWEEDFDEFENRVIMQLIEDNPKSLQTIEHLSINMFYNAGYQNLSIESAYALCEVCNNLRILGELHTWFKVSREDVDELSRHIKKNNWDVQISYRDVLYPKV